MSDFYIPPPETSANLPGRDSVPELDRFKLEEVATPPKAKEIQDVVGGVEVTDVLSDAERLANLAEELPTFEASFAKLDFAQLDRDFAHNIRVSTAGEPAKDFYVGLESNDALYGGVQWADDKSTTSSSEDGLLSDSFKVTDADIEELFGDFDIIKDTDPAAAPIAEIEEDLGEFDPKKVLLEIDSYIVAPLLSPKGAALRGLGAAIKAHRAVLKKGSQIKADSTKAFSQYVEKAVVDEIKKEALLALKAHSTGELPKKGDVSKTGRRKILGLVASMEDKKDGAKNQQNIMTLARISEADLAKLIKTEPNEIETVGSAEENHRVRKLTLGLVAAGVIIGSLAGYVTKNSGNSNNNQEVSLSAGTASSVNTIGWPLDSSRGTVATTLAAVPETTIAPPTTKEVKPTTTSTVQTISTKPAEKAPVTTTAPPPPEKEPVSKKYRLVIAKTDSMQMVLDRLQKDTGEAWTAETFAAYTGLKIGTFVGAVTINDCAPDARLVQTGEGRLKNGDPATAGMCVREVA